MMQNALIEWDGEDTASVVPCCHVGGGGGVFEVGQISEVITGQGKYRGLVAATG